LEIIHRIINATEMLFTKYGVKSISMDDIARETGMSKKTLYQHFTDKEDIVTHTTQNVMKRMRDEMLMAKANSKNAVEEMILISEILKKNFQSMNPALLFDLKKYHPKAWICYCNQKETSMMDHLKDNLEQGIKEGLYRDDIDVNVLARLRMEEVQIAFDPMLFPRDQFDLSNVQMQFFNHFLHGITTLKGHKLLNKYKQINEED